MIVSEGLKHDFTAKVEAAILRGPAGLRRYLVFAGRVYDPEGGWDDFVCSHASLRRAKEKADALAKGNVSETWAQVVDATTGLMVYRTVFNGRRQRKSQTVEA